MCIHIYKDTSIWEWLGSRKKVIYVQLKENQNGESNFSIKVINNTNNGRLFFAWSDSKDGQVFLTSINIIISLKYQNRVSTII